MKVARCGRCGQRRSVLPDGTLVEHAGRNSPALLSPGSRTDPSLGEEGPAGQLRHLLDQSLEQREAALRN
jgi:hypothetical protein